VAPYFIDAEAAPGNAAAPVGGLTVVSFHDNHLVYALTWYALAAMTAGAALRLLRERE
jgi:surfeit locus 1 family protein